MSEIIERLEELRADWRRKHMTGDEQRTNDTLTLAITVIKAIEPLEWTSVDESLPEEDVPVLCCTDDDEVSIFSHHNSFETFQNLRQ